MSKATDLPGFEVPLHRSLTEPILLAVRRAPWRLPTAR